MKPILILLILSSVFIAAQTPISLEEAYQKALENNPEIKFQNLNSEYMKSLENTVKMVDPLNVSADLGQMNSIYFDNGITLEQSFKFPGYYNSQKQVKIEEWKQAMMQTELQAHQLKKELALVYNQLNYLNEKENFLNKIDSLFKEYYRLAKLRVSNGESSILEETTAENYRAKAQIELEQIKDEKTWALYQFNYLISDGNLYTSLPSEFYQTPIMSAILDTEINPIYLQSIEQEKEISNARIEAEKAKKKPSFGLLFTNMSMYGNGANDVFYNYSKRFSSGMVGLSIPLFNKGLKAKIESEKINQDLTESTINLKKRNLEMQANELKMQISKIQKVQNYYAEKGNSNAKTILNTAQKLYFEGEINYLEWSLLVNQSLEIQNNYIENQRILNNSMIELNALQNEN